MYKIVRFLTDSNYRFLVSESRGLCNNMPDEEFLRRKFKALLQYDLNLDCPETFNEKLQWLKLHDRNPLYSLLVDKIAVKDWVAERIGHDYITPTYSVWNNVDEVDVGALPERFALKTNHDSGGIALCQDKSLFNEEAAKKRLRESMGRNYYWVGREWPYMGVNPKVFAEELIIHSNDLDQSAGKSNPTDYKVLCFGGEPKLIELHKGRFGRHTQDMYTPAWDWVDITQPETPPAGGGDREPYHLREMLEFSALLSRGMCHVRVDWYDCEEGLRFGEMTFYDGSGFAPFEDREDDLLLGSWIDLSLAYGPLK